MPSILRDFCFCLPLGNNYCSYCDNCQWSIIYVTLSTHLLDHQCLCQLLEDLLVCILECQAICHQECPIKCHQVCWKLPFSHATWFKAFLGNILRLLKIELWVGFLFLGQILNTCSSFPDPRIKMDISELLGKLDYMWEVTCDGLTSRRRGFSLYFFVL